MWKTKMTDLKIGKRLIGEGQPCYIVAEIGINHNGDVAIAKQLIKVAADVGCEAVKFQKRTVSEVYSGEELAMARVSPFGRTNGDLKHGLEFGQDEYRQIFAYAAELNIHCTASVWDESSVDFLEQFDPPFYKIPSPMLTHKALLKRCQQTNKPIVLSTGMSALDQVSRAIELLGPDNLILLHCTSAYPCPPSALNLRAIETLRNTFGCAAGYSGHEDGILPTVASRMLGSVMIERHVTLDRQMWGTDQSISLESDQLEEMVQSIRAIEVALGSGEIGIRDCELPALKKLRRFP
jgi:N-acetylneuraminate synthase